jgi:hypothetical protein
MSGQIDAHAGTLVLRQCGISTRLNICTFYSTPNAKPKNVVRN